MGFSITHNFGGKITFTMQQTPGRTQLSESCFKMIFLCVANFIFTTICGKGVSERNKCSTFISRYHVN